MSSDDQNISAYWDMVIDQEIRAFNLILDGENESLPIEPFRIYASGHGEKLEMAMLPLFKEYILYPEERMICSNLWYKNGGDEEKRAQMEMTNRIEEHIEPYIADAIEGQDLIEILERSVLLENGCYHPRIYYKTILLNAVIQDFETDWEDLYHRVKAELKHGPKDYDRLRMEYYCLLMSVIMIKRSAELTSDEKCEMFMTLRDTDVWNLFAHLYSIMIGLIVGSNYSNFIQIVDLFAENRKKYAHLMLAAIKVRPSVLNAKNSWKQNKYINTYNKLYEAQNEEEADHSLDDLFNVIFPKAALEEYSQVTNRMTASETQHQLESQQSIINDLTKQINNQNIELSELRLYRDAAEKIINSQKDDVLLIEDLKKAIEDIRNPEKAQQFYFQLDFYLAENDAWNIHRNEFRFIIKAKFNAQEQALPEQTSRIVDAIGKQPPSIIGQLNMGNGSQQLPPGFGRTLGIEQK